MKTIEEYKVISASTEEDLTYKVNHHLKQGYVLNGELKVSSAGSSSLLGGTVTKIYSQAIVLYEGESKPVPEQEQQQYNKYVENNDCLLFCVIIGAGFLLQYLMQFL